jgi:hypothetical protein
MKKFRPIDGVVDNGVDYENYTEIGSGLEIVGKTNSVEITNGGQFIINSKGGLKPDTTYAMKFTINENTNVVNVANLYLRQNSEQAESLILSQVNIGNEWLNSGTYTINFTTISDITDKYVFLQKNLGDLLILSDVVIYEGASIPVGQPSGLFESNNSIVIADDYFINDPENLLYNADGSKKVIPYDDLANITNNQLIVSEDKQSIYFYDEPLDVDSKCFEKALKQAKLIEPLQTTESGGVENAYTTESTGIELAYCYKDFVEVE